MKHSEGYRGGWVPKSSLRYFVPSELRQIDRKGGVDNRELKTAPYSDSRYGTREKRVDTSFFGRVESRLNARLGERIYSHATGSDIHSDILSSIATGKWWEKLSLRRALVLVDVVVEVLGGE